MIRCVRGEEGRKARKKEIKRIKIEQTHLDNHTTHNEGHFLTVA